MAMMHCSMKVSTQRDHHSSLNQYDCLISFWTFWCAGSCSLLKLSGLCLGMSFAHICALWLPLLWIESRSYTTIIRSIITVMNSHLSVVSLKFSLIGVLESYWKFNCVYPSKVFHELIHRDKFLHHLIIMIIRFHSEPSEATTIYC